MTMADAEVGNEPPRFSHQMADYDDDEQPQNHTASGRSGGGGSILKGGSAREEGAPGPRWNQSEDYLAPSENPLKTPPPKKQVSYRGLHQLEEEQRPVSRLNIRPDSDDESEMSSDPDAPQPVLNSRLSTKEKAQTGMSKEEQKAERKSESDRRKMLRASQMPSQYTVHGTVKKKTMLIRFVKCGGMATFIILSIFLVTYGLIYGFGVIQNPSTDDPGEPAYDLQQVLPGQLLALSSSGKVAAIQNDYETVQIYGYTFDDAVDTDRDEQQPLWKPMGQSFKVIGRVSLSRNGTIAAFISQTDRRPHVLEYDPDKNVWFEKNAPLIICDELSMDIDASFLTVGAYNRREIGTWQDFVASYEYNAGDWNEVATRLEFEDSIISFEMSPTAQFLMISTMAVNASMIDIGTYRLSVEDEDPQWMKLNNEMTLEGLPTAFSLAEDVFALSTYNSTLNVYSYSGRVWGQDLFPRLNSTFASVALSLDGRTLAVGDIAQNNTGIVNRYTFPWTADTGDDWEEDGPPLEYDWQLDEGYINDQYGNEAPVFGSRILLDGVGSTIAVQSGLEGNQNVHFYDVLHPESESELAEEDTS